MYNCKVISWGHSQAISVPKEVKEKLNLEIGQSLTMYVTNDDEIIIARSDSLKLNPEVIVKEKD